MSTRTSSRVLPLAAVALMAGLWITACQNGSDHCSTGSGPIRAATYGQMLFADPGLSESRMNAFSCATCHSVAKTPDPARINSGYSLYDVASRPIWWGGYEARLSDAVDFCYQAFMRGVMPLDRNDPRSKALYEYLVSVSPDGMAAPLPMTVVKDIADVPRGDLARGEAVFKGACQTCHGELHSGKGRLTDRAVTLPEYFSTYPATFPNIPAAKVVIEKVRHGEFFQIGGNMPLYTKEALSDEDLGALLAYLGI